MRRRGLIARLDVDGAQVIGVDRDPSELARVTRPGGLVVIGGLQRNSPWGWWNRRQFDETPPFSFAVTCCPSRGGPNSMSM